MDVNAGRREGLELSCGIWRLWGDENKWVDVNGGNGCGGVSEGIWSGDVRDLVLREGFKGREWRIDEEYVKIKVDMGGVGFRE